MGFDDRSHPDGSCLPNKENPSETHSLGVPIGEKQDRESTNVVRKRVFFADYELLETIGDAGGMGIVNRAVEQSFLRRTVALKRIKAGLEADEVDTQRFKIEVESVANFDHPNIIKVFHCGTHEGQLYYSMPLLEHGSLRAKLNAQRQLEQHDAASIVRDVADAIAYAHQREILHRDLKPANILFDGLGNPIVIDFGCAKRLGDLSDLTISSTPLGTFAYMPPEQVREAGSVNETADVFSLGAILYKCVVGRAPFQGETVYETWERLVSKNYTPQRPSDANPLVHRDLEAICLKCIEKDPSRRYQSAELLVEDLDHFLAGESTSARPRTYWQRVTDWCNKKRLAVATLSLIAMVCVILTGLLLTNEYRVEPRSLVAPDPTTTAPSMPTDEPDEWQYASRFSEVYAKWQNADISSNDARLEALVQDSTFDHVASWERGYLDHIVRASAPISRIVHDHPSHCIAADPSREQVAFGDAAGQVHLLRPFKSGWQSHVTLQHHSSGETGPINDLAFSSDGRLLLACTASGRLLLWRDQAGIWAETESVLVDSQDSLTQIALSLDASHVVVGTESGAIYIFNVMTKAMTYSLFDAFPDGIKKMELGFLANIPCLLIASGGQVQIQKLDDNAMALVGSPKTVIEWTSDISSLALDPGGRMVAAGAANGSLLMWYLDAPRDQKTVELNAQSPKFRDVMFNRGGHLLLTADESGIVRYWNPFNGKDFGPVAGHGSPVQSATFIEPPVPRRSRWEFDGLTSLLDRSESSFRFATIDADSTIQFWQKSPSTSETLVALGLPQSPVRSLACSADSRTIFCTHRSGDQNEIRSWNVKNRTMSSRVAFASDDEIKNFISLKRVEDDLDDEFAVHYQSGIVEIWNGFSPTHHQRVASDGAAIAFTPVMDGFLALDKQRQLKRWDKTSTDWEMIRGPIAATTDRLHGTRTSAVVVDRGHGVVDCLANRTSGGSEGRLMDLSAESVVAVSPEGRRVAVCNDRRTIQIRTATTDSLLMTLTEESGDVSALVFSPDGRLLIAGNERGEIRLWGNSHPHE